MTSNFDASISFLEIVNSFEKLFKRAKNPNHGQHFERLALNHRILTKLQIDIYQRDLFVQDITSPELLMLKRGTVFNWSTLQSSIDFFRWSRASTVEELANQAYQSARDNSLLVAIMALRSILEISGNVALLEKDFHDLVKPADENIDLMDRLRKFSS
jgi:hypothetical protein